MKRKKSALAIKLNTIFLVAALSFSTVFIAGCGNKSDASKDAASVTETEEESVSTTEEAPSSTAEDEKTTAETASYDDGKYTPSFAFTGGSGKVTISCDEVEIIEGQAFAKLIFSSSKYTWVKVDDVQYDNENSGGDSTFTIPVKLDTVTQISAETTAMSTPHVVDYEVYVYLTGDASKAAGVAKTDETSIENKTETDSSFAAPEIEGITYESTVVNDYAECFAIHHYSDDFTLIQVNDGSSYLLVPESTDKASKALNDKVINSVSDEITVLQKPLDKIYLAATASMALFDALDAIDNIKMSAVDADSWYVDDAAEAMKNGEIAYAGKYSSPDYELLINSSCSVAIESTMILHTPEVKEKLEELGIPVFVDRASYEKHPLARTEWIRVYAEFVDKADEADTFLKDQEKIVNDIEDVAGDKPVVAFFYVNTNGVIVVRKSADYMAKMIDLAGGQYVFENLGSDESSASSTVDMTMEEFFASAKDADYIIYNASIADELDSVKALIAKSELFSQFKAVKEGNVWCTNRSIYQATGSIGTIINEINEIISGTAADEMEFIYHLD